MNDFTADEIVADAKKRALRQITQHAESLRNHLEGVQRGVNRALESMAKGEMAPGLTFGFGPIGHQAPFDITVHTTKLNAAIQFAQEVGATSEEIDWAYRFGVAHFDKRHQMYVEREALSQKVSA